jgi:hypothetical protein
MGIITEEIPTKIINIKILASPEIESKREIYFLKGVQDVGIYRRSGSYFRSGIPRSGFHGRVCGG